VYISHLRIYRCIRYIYIYIIYYNIYPSRHGSFTPDWVYIVTITKHRFSESSIHDNLNIMFRTNFAQRKELPTRGRTLCMFLNEFFCDHFRFDAIIYIYFFLVQSSKTHAIVILSLQIKIIIFLLSTRNSTITSKYCDGTQ